MLKIGEIKRKTTKKTHIRGEFIRSFFVYLGGGELGIRTLETLLKSMAFREPHLQPLGQLSALIFCCYIYYYQNSQYANQTLYLLKKKFGYGIICKNIWKVKHMKKALIGQILSIYNGLFYLALGIFALGMFTIHSIEAVWKGIPKGRLYGYKVMESLCLT